MALKWSKKSRTYLDWYPFSHPDSAEFLLNDSLIMGNLFLILMAGYDKKYYAEIRYYCPGRSHSDMAVDEYFKQNFL
jgi:hypothetical protein